MEMQNEICTVSTKNGICVVRARVHIDGAQRMKYNNTIR